MAWASHPRVTENGLTTILATANYDKRVMFWTAPKFPSAISQVLVYSPLITNLYRVNEMRDVH